MSITLNSSSYASMMGSIKKTILSAATKNLVELMRVELIPSVLDNLMGLYDAFVSEYHPSYDPANPSSPEVKEAFRESLKRGLESSLSENAGSIQMVTGDTEELGYTKHNLSYLKSGVPRDPSPLDWLIFYLEGFIGEFYFVTKEDFELFHAAGLKSQESLEKFEQWGWFGEGFLIKADVYKAQGFDKVKGSTPKRHPFSGMRPSHLFGWALEAVDLDSLAKRAFESAMEAI